MLVDGYRGFGQHVGRIFSGQAVGEQLLLGCFILPSGNYIFFLNVSNKYLRTPCNISGEKKAQLNLALKH